MSLTRVEMPGVTAGVFTVLNPAQGTFQSQPEVSDMQQRVRVAVDTTAPSAAGSEAQIDVFFNNSPVFRLAPNAAAKGIRPVIWFDSASPLRSGWAWGQNYLEGGTTAFEATVGQGRVYAFGPEITFRAQPHGTFKFLFNAIHTPARGAVTPTNTSASRWT